MLQRKYLILLSSVGFWVSLDQLTKLLVLMHYKLGESLPILPNIFSLTLVHNPGAAFGLLASLPTWIREPFFLVVPGLTLIFIFYVFYRTSESNSLSVYALSAVVGGALGNIIDRLRLTYVIDFFDFHWKTFYHFPAFNIADCAISLGVTALLIAMVLERDDAKA